MIKVNEDEWRGVTVTTENDGGLLLFRAGNLVGYYPAGTWSNINHKEDTE